MLDAVTMNQRKNIDLMKFSRSFRLHNLFCHKPFVVLQQHAMFFVRVVIPPVNSVAVHVGSLPVHIRRLPSDTKSDAQHLPAKDLNFMFKTASAMKHMRHDNVNRFVGICFDYRAAEENASTVSAFEYQQRGTVRRLLQDSDTVDADLTISFIGDCLSGLRALHEIDLVHGFLHTDNILVDNKLTCKITDYGLGEFGHPSTDLDPIKVTQLTDDDQILLLKLLFRSPEQLRDGYKGCTDIKCSDVFSMGVVMAEIVTRDEPVFVPRAVSTNLPSILTSSIDVIKRQISVANGILGPIVPLILDDKCLAGLQVLIYDCCDKSDERPNIVTLNKRFAELLTATDKGQCHNLSFVERLAERLDRYTDNLQALVSERTQSLVEQTRSTDQLLLQLLPASVCAELKAGHAVDPEAFECVSIYFSDIVGFTALSARSTPVQIVVLLNSLYTAFDDVVGKHRVYKLQTIGDAYMVVSGVPERIGNKFHGKEISDFSLDIVDALRIFTIPHVESKRAEDDRIKMRIGLHCGPVVAGVVGSKMPRYCLFGNAVNIANQMESNGLPLRIHVSRDFHALVKHFWSNVYVWEPSSIHSDDNATYWLNKKVQ